MIGSDNNQSQVIGASVLLLWGKALNSLLTAKTRELIIVDGVFLHGGLIGVELNRAIILCIGQASATKYRSVFMELCKALAEAVLKVDSLLTHKAK
jgi:hypothetical protein